jgi:hypothetical protein
LRQVPAADSKPQKSALRAVSWRVNWGIIREGGPGAKKAAKCDKTPREIGQIGDSSHAQRNDNICESANVTIL